MIANIVLNILLIGLCGFAVFVGAVALYENNRSKGSPEWYAAQRAQQRQAMRERVDRATVLDLYRDGRKNLLGSSSFYSHPTENLIPLREDVQEWLDANARGWGRISSEIAPRMGGAIFFDHEDDALHFKMRWY